MDLRLIGLDLYPRKVQRFRFSINIVKVGEQGRNNVCFLLGSEVFVGKIPHRIFEPDLVPLFEKIGPIYEMRLMIDFRGLNRGFCFITYMKPEHAARAIKELNGYEIQRGRRIGVVASMNNNRLYIGGIPYSKTEAEVYEELDKITEGITKVVLPPSIDSNKNNRGFAFVDYETHKAACMARRKLIPNSIRLWGNRDIHVDWAYDGQDIRSLHVQNVSPLTTTDKLKSIFNQVTRNGVVSVRMFKDYSFVHFSSRDQALTAKAALNGVMIDGNVLKINWTKPTSRYHNKWFMNDDWRKNNQTVATMGQCQPHFTVVDKPEETRYKVPSPPKNKGEKPSPPASRYKRPPPIQIPPPEPTPPPFQGRYQPNTQSFQPPVAYVPTAYPSYHLDPINRLLWFCRTNGWGEPLFTPISFGHGQSVCFSGSIYISCHPTGPKEFRTSEVYSTPQEAQAAAAMQLLNVIQSESNPRGNQAQFRYGPIGFLQNPYANSSTPQQ